MYEEYNMQTASGTAESDVSGVYMNMVTKSGGNRINSDHNFYFMNDALQTTNIDDDLRARLGLQPGQQSGAAGNPDRHLVRLELDARRADQARQGLGLWRDPLVAARSVPDRRAQPGRLSRHRRQPHPQLHGQGDLPAQSGDAGVVHVQPESEGSVPPPRRWTSAKTRRRCCRISRRRTTSRS